MLYKSLFFLLFIYSPYLYIIIFKNQDAYLDNKYFWYQMITININMMCIFEML